MKTAECETERGDIIRYLEPPTNLFLQHPKLTWNYRLGDTNYWYNAVKNIWFYDPQYYSRDWSYGIRQKFEDVMDNSPVEYQEELLFHLNYFLRKD